MNSAKVNIFFSTKEHYSYKYGNCSTSKNKNPLYSILFRIFATNKKTDLWTTSSNKIPSSLR